jgi:B9 domain-containing protein 2
MAEIHVIGEIVGASQFSKDDLFCMFNIQKGRHWIHVSGEEKGQTQVDKRGQDGMNIWSHPIDLHYSTSVCVGWPKVVIQVWFQDEYGRNDFAGYGVVNIPTQSGTFDLQCEIWKPLGSTTDRLIESLLGGSSQLKDDSLVWSGEDRRKLTTVTVGRVHLHLNVLLRNFSKYGVQTTHLYKSDLQVD